jgi:hypothetical protein
VSALVRAPALRRLTLLQPPSLYQALLKLPPLLCVNGGECYNLHRKKSYLQVRYAVLRIQILLLSSVTFNTSTKKMFFSKFFAYFFLKVHLHHFPMIKGHKEVTKQ